MRVGAHARKGKFHHVRLAHQRGPGSPQAGHRHGIWVGICGELGADTALTETFLRMGVDELSMNAKSILPVRKIIRSVDLSKPSEKA